MGKSDNRDLWKSSSYREFGIIGEPYFDIDFNEVMYLTDTGRRWDGSKFNIRDRVSGDRQEARGDREDGGQKAEDREQKEEDRCQKTENRGQRTENREQKEEDRGQKGKDGRGEVGSPGEQTNQIRQSERMIGAVTLPALCIHSSEDIIKALTNNRLADKIMPTIQQKKNAK